MTLGGLIIDRQQSAWPPYRPISTLRIYQEERVIADIDLQDREGVLPIGKVLVIPLEGAGPHDIT